MNNHDPHDRLFPADVPVIRPRFSDLPWMIAAVVAGAVATAVAALADTWSDSANRVAVAARVFSIFVFTPKVEDDTAAVFSVIVGQKSVAVPVDIKDLPLP
jgi:hypothetical protein